MRASSSTSSSSPISPVRVGSATLGSTKLALEKAALGKLKTREDLAKDILMLTVGAGTDLGKELGAKMGVKFARKETKDALKALMASGRCIYSYAGKSAVVLNPEHADNADLF